MQSTQIEAEYLMTYLAPLDTPVPIDDALIYMSYNGILQHSAESAERMNKGELLTTKDIPYFVTAPTFQTAAPKYAWLNSVQAINKVVELKIGDGGYVKYDVFVVR